MLASSSQVIAQPALAGGESRRDRLQRQAVGVARRYRQLGHTAAADTTAAFFLLLDLMTFFDLFHAKKPDEAIDILAKIKVCCRDLFPILGHILT